MPRYEYKSITLDQKGWGLFKSRTIPDLDKTLNEEGRKGWRLNNVIQPSGAYGESDKVILILEKLVE